MAKLAKAALGQVSCATPSNIETVDEKIHTMVRYAPLAVAEVKDGAPIDEKAAFAALRTVVAFVQAVAKGEDAEITDPTGKIIKVLKPTDSMPSKRVEKPAGNKPGDKATVAHGTNMGRTLPGQITDSDPTGWATVLDIFNAGMLQKTGILGRGDISRATRSGDGKAGRKGADVDLDDAE